MKKTTGVKGMTLIEIVVSMCIYGVLALLIVEIMTLVNTTMRASTQLNKRLAYEAKYADNGLTADTMDSLFENASLSSTAETKNLTITYGATTQNATASQYTARYKNPNAGANYKDYSEKVNYRYMVYETVVPTDVDPSGDFVVNLTFADDYPNYTITNIEAVPSSGIVRNGDGSYSITTGRASATAENGIVHMSVTLYRDMRGETNGQRVEIFTTDGDGNRVSTGYYSDNYPYATVNLDFVTWIKNADGTFSENNVFNSATFMMNSDGRSVTANGSVRN